MARESREGNEGFLTPMTRIQFGKPLVLACLSFGSLEMGQALFGSGIIRKNRREQPEMPVNQGTTFGVPGGSLF